MRFWIFLIFLGSAVGCGSSGGLGGAVLPPPGATVTLSDIQAPIFEQRCAVSGCHVGAGAPFGLDLSSGQSYATTVGVPSAEEPAFARVDPGNALDSYLYMKVTADPRISGDPMPLLSAPLSGAQIDLIAAWIEQGANP